MLNTQLPGLIETGRSPFGADGSRGLPQIGSNAHLITGQIKEKFQDDLVAATTNTVMALAIAARAHYADGDWRHDSRTLNEVPVQHVYVKSLGELVLASWEQNTDTQEHAPTAFHEIADAIALRLSGEFNPHELAILLKSSYELRVKQYGEHLKNKQQIKEDGEEHVEGSKTSSAVSPSPFGDHAEVPDIDVRELNDAALVNIALDFIIEDIAWESLQEMVKPIWDQAMIDKIEPEFPEKRFILEVLAKFVTRDRYKYFMRHPIHSEHEPAKERIRFTKWVFEAAEKERNDLYSPNLVEVKKTDTVAT